MLLKDSHSRNSEPSRRIVELDGLRGLAILLVVVFHYFSGVQTKIGSWQAYAVVPLRLCWSGVDLFFVLSGFLIARILIQSKTEPNYYQIFYRRRVRRIFPVYFLWCALFLIGLSFADNGHSTSLKAIFNTALPLLSYPLFLQNFFMASRSTHGASWMGITWSLAVEEQFYLMLPFLVRHLSLQKLLSLTVTIIVIAPILRIGVYLLFGAPLLAIYTLLPCRADSLAFGVLAALIIRNRPAMDHINRHLSSLRLALIALAMGLLILCRHVYDIIMISIGYTWIAAFYTTLVLIAVSVPAGLEQRLLRNRLCLHLGMISYSLYLFHSGINGLLHWSFFNRAPLIDSWPSAFVTILSLVTTVFLSMVSWRFIELPILNHRRSVPRTQMVSQQR